jgi:AmiR/NasT family two-component response regulator
VSPQERTKVLIAEDEAIIRLDLKEMLEEEGLQVVGEAADGEAVLRLAAERHPDLVIMDIKMPGLDGLSAAERLAEKGEAAVLILTAFSQKDLVQRAAEAGAMGYLVKPFQRSDLIPAIDIALARHAQLRALNRGRCLPAYPEAGHGRAPFHAGDSRLDPRCVAPVAKTGYFSPTDVVGGAGKLPHAEVRA